MLISLVVYCLLGAIAGVLAGLLGVGGGIVIVPMLVFAFGWQNFPQDVLMLMALGTSMGSIMFTSIPARWPTAATRASSGMPYGTSPPAS